MDEAIVIILVGNVDKYPDKLLYSNTILVKGHSIENGNVNVNYLCGISNLILII